MGFTRSSAATMTKPSPLFTLKGIIVGNTTVGNSGCQTELAVAKELGAQLLGLLLVYRTGIHAADNDGDEA